MGKTDKGVGRVTAATFTVGTVCVPANLPLASQGGRTRNDEGVLLLPQHVFYQEAEQDIHTWPYCGSGGNERKSLTMHHKTPSKMGDAVPGLIDARFCRKGGVRPTSGDGRGDTGYREAIELNLWVEGVHGRSQRQG